ncbi:MAG TPA: DUF3267 domain-containing protein [Puia sp.]|nr:DUF3267 domain-containing protein [Puia sp.]
MNLKPEELEENGYILLDEMHHVEIVPFVKKFLHKWTWFSLLYYLSVIISFSLLLFFCMKLYRSGIHTIDKILLQIFLGILLTLALIPFHEWIHALAYKSQGAKQTSFDANLKRFYFLAIADKFVTGKREFKIVALAPFLIISLALIIASCFSGESWKITLFTTLTIHSLACSGDFALLSYFEFNKKKEVVTYDDKENKVSFFYGREK